MKIIEQLFGSYFFLDVDAQLSPISEAVKIFENDIFELDTNTGDLSPSNDGDVSEFFEIDLNDDITIKIL